VLFDVPAGGLFELVIVPAFRSASALTDTAMTCKNSAALPTLAHPMPTGMPSPGQLGKA